MPPRNRTSVPRQLRPLPSLLLLRWRCYPLLLLLPPFFSWRHLNVTKIKELRQLVLRGTGVTSSSEDNLASKQDRRSSAALGYTTASSYIEPDSRGYVPENKLHVPASNLKKGN